MSAILSRLNDMHAELAALDSDPYETRTLTVYYGRTYLPATRDEPEEIGDWMRIGTDLEDLADAKSMGLQITSRRETFELDADGLPIEEHGSDAARQGMTQ